MINDLPDKDILSSNCLLCKTVSYAKQLPMVLFIYLARRASYVLRIERHKYAAKIGNLVNGAGSIASRVQFANSCRYNYLMKEDRILIE